jgi:hypothetical protein
VEECRAKCRNQKVLRQHAAPARTAGEGNANVHAQRKTY